MKERRPRIITTNNDFLKRYRNLHTLNEEQTRRHFSGLIYPSDFYTNENNNNETHSVIAQRMLSAERFDLECKRNIEGRSKRMNRKVDMHV